MKMSIRTRILLLVLSSVAAALLVVGGISLYALFDAQRAMTEQGNEAANRLAESMGSRAEHDAKQRLREVTETRAQHIDRELALVGEDVEYMSIRMTQLLQRPWLQRPRELPVVSMDEETLSGRTYIHYPPGMAARNPGGDLQREIGAAGNFADTLAAMAASYSGYRTCFFAASQNGYNIFLEIVPETNDGRVGKVYVSEEEKLRYITEYDHREKSWYLLGLQADKPMYDVPRMGSEGVMETTCMMAYHDGDGRPAGVVGITYNTGDLRRMVEEVAFQQETMIVVLDEGGNVQLSTEKEGVLAVQPGVVDLRKATKPDIAEAARRMTAGESGVMSVDLRGDGNIYYLAFAPMKSIGWSLGALVEDDEVLGSVEQAADDVRESNRALQETLHDSFSRALFHAGLMLLPVLGLVFYGSGFLSARVTRPIKRLANGVQEIAEGNFDKKLSLPTGDEIEHLADCYNAMTDKLKEYTKNLEQAAAEKEHARTELEMAARIQTDLLPRPLPRRKEFDLCAAIYPAKDVGGDFYDFYLLDESRLVVAIADVSGKGFPAALFMAASMTVLRNCFLAERQTGNVAAILESANRQLCQNNESAMFVTVFLGILDLATGRLTYADGGHCRPFLRHGGSCEPLPMEKSSMLGLMELPYQQQSIDLAPGDTLFLYTDGVSEAMDEEKRLFTEPRIRDTLNALPPEQDVAGILSAVLEAVRRHAGNAEQSDDITMLGLRYLPRG